LTVSLPTNVTCQYDANGNLTNDGTRWFYYDAENQLTNVTVSGQWQVLFGYDGLNRRRYESNFTWQSGNWTLTNAVRFIYDGMQILQERDTGNNPMVTYTRGPDLSMTLAGAGGIGGLLARTDANGSTCYHADAAGNITALTDANQNIVARYEYDAFGRLIGFWGTMGPVNRMRFSSKRHVTQADLYDFGYRWYPPNLQRWLTRDPLGIIAGLNPYTFSGNGSINQIDPYGHANWFTRLGDAIVSPISDLMVGAAEFNGVTSRNSQLAGNGYVNQQDLDISSKHFNCVLTAGNLDAVGAAGRIAAGATGLYLNAIPSILTGGLSAPETAFLGAEEDSVLAAGESALVSDNTAQLGYSLASDLAPAAETAAEDSLTLYHGTTANAAGSILDGGFRAGADNAVFFGEDFATARYFGEERIAETGASSGQVLRYTVPQSLAEDIGLAERHVLGEFRGAPPIDIPHASGFERILQGGNIGLFNQAVRSGQIAVKVFRIGY
jgi:RHS repeat-associated protein